ncbi:MAG: phage holin family protein [Gemmatimonadaceae bacterium]
MSLLVRLLINAAALYAATRIVDGISFSGTWQNLLLVALIFAVVNTAIKPILKLFSFPVILLTAGLFLIVINAAMLLLTSTASARLDLGFHVAGFFPAFVGAMVVSAVAMVLNAVFGSKKDD